MFGIVGLPEKPPFVLTYHCTFTVQIVWHTKAQNYHMGIFLGLTLLQKKPNLFKLVKFCGTVFFRKI